MRKGFTRAWYDFSIGWALLIVSCLLSSTVIGNWIFLLVGLVIAVFKLFSSFRLYPTLADIYIDDKYIYKVYCFIKTKKIPLSHIHLYKTKYHGLQYIIFSPYCLTSLYWKDIAIDRQIIAYPYSKYMKSNFPDMFSNIESLSDTTA